MRLEYGRNSFSGLERGQENGYMLTNGLGGYSSLTAIGSNARNDHALFMASVKAPNHRYHMVTRTDEVLCISDRRYDLSSQQFVGYTDNRDGYRYLDYFCMEYLPLWVYRVPGIEIRKTVVMPQGENTVGIQYEINNRTGQQAVFLVTPLFQFTEKGEKCRDNKRFRLEEGVVCDDTFRMYYKTEGETVPFKQEYVDGLYYAYDARDGRPAVGGAYRNHEVRFVIPAGEAVTKSIIYSMEEIGDDGCAQMMDLEISRQKELVRTAGFEDETASMIAKNCNQFVVRRESVHGKSIIAGYPFFGDWGRDTMIALPGCCIATGQMEDARNILGTFIEYQKGGLMPNLFPEGCNDPEYNTVDASLLFAGAVYEYFQAGGDKDFVMKKAYPAIKEIIAWYRKGTDFHIRMEEDGLITAGSGLEQVTWMDVRINGFLPTARHGKPVEVNAYWYNVLRIAGYFGNLFGEDTVEYTELADRVRDSFVKQFWMEEKGCLRDVLSGTDADEQIRCNQIWAVSQPFSVLDHEKEVRVVDQVYEHLYTPYGLRTLSFTDKEFRPEYGGSLLKRDMSYHQGTVWTFPLGAYYLAYLKVHGDTVQAAGEVREQLRPMGELLKEGCAGHLAEIYDGMYPDFSRGCFAQAWSMGEMMRVYKKLDEIERQGMRTLR